MAFEPDSPETLDRASLHDRIARRLRAKAVVPFHFSPRYEGRGAEVIAEVQAAWK